MSAAKAATKKAERHAAGQRRLPTTRDALLALHRELRRERDGAALQSRERAEAMTDIGRIEVEIARLDRAADPPRV